MAPSLSLKVTTSLLSARQHNFGSAPSREALVGRATPSTDGGGCATSAVEHLQINRPRDDVNRRRGDV